MEGLSRFGLYELLDLSRRLKFLPQPKVIASNPRMDRSLLPNPAGVPCAKLIILAVRGDCFLALSLSARLGDGSWVTESRPGFSS